MFNVVFQNNDSYFSKSLTACSMLITRAPKKPLVGALASVAACLAMMAIKPDTLLTKVVTVAGTSAVAGYVVHRIYDLASERIVKKIIAPVMVEYNTLESNFWGAINRGDQEGARAALEAKKKFESLDK